MPINQVATVSTPDARTISVQVWDKGQVSAVEKAIREANLGLNPVTDGALIRLPIPALNAERRQELVKVAHKYAEHARVAVRNVRRDGMELLKKLDKDGQMSEDDHHKNSAKVQELTDKLIKEIDQTLVGQGNRDQAGMRASVPQPTAVAVRRRPATAVAAACVAA